MRRNRDESSGGSIKQVIVLLALAFVVALGVVIGTRMSSDALAVLVGVIAGVAASIPTALLLMAVTRRQEHEPDYEYVEPYEDRRQSGPPVIVVTPGGVPQQLPQYGAPYAYPPPPDRRRQFRVMGDDGEDQEPVEGQAEVVSWYG